MTNLSPALCPEAKVKDRRAERAPGRIAGAGGGGRRPPQKGGSSPRADQRGSMGPGRKGNQASYGKRIALFLQDPAPWRTPAPARPAPAPGLHSAGLSRELPALLHLRAPRFSPGPWGDWAALRARCPALPWGRPRPGRVVGLGEGLDHFLKEPFSEGALPVRYRAIPISLEKSLFPRGPCF